MIHFKNVQSRCYVLLLESEVVKIADMGLGFYMRRKLINVHVPDLAHLTKKVCQVEILQKEKEKFRNEKKYKSKVFARKEKVSYVKMGSSSEEFDFKFPEVDLTKQKPKDRDSYLCPRCNAIFDAEAATIFEKERMKKELAHKEEQICQRHPSRRQEVEMCNIYINLKEVIKAFIETITLIIEVGPKEVEVEDVPSTSTDKGVTPSAHTRIVFPFDGKTYPKRIPSPAKIKKGKSVVVISDEVKEKDADLDEEYFDEGDEGDEDMVSTISIIPTEYWENMREIE
ncbi:hypothetical protein Ahy_A07g035658 [Arachis hypogaea]|uniref:Uncharacterized protein n=1 Tax=Arachis hypogaea TaxID=3818 RepID=A0A445CEA6_ARAHY|nr:hypothetical protein Ahy_A07g035658 [Arachis hypogaea]